MLVFSEDNLDLETEVDLAPMLLKTMLLIRREDLRAFTYFEDLEKEMIKHLDNMQHELAMMN